MKAAFLAREFSRRNARPGDGRLMLQPADAIALIDRAAEEGVPIVSIQGAAAAAATPESPREHAIDFSSRVREGHGCWQEADTFVRERGELDLVFELTLGDDPVEAV